MNVEVRATGLRAMRDKHRLTQRELAHRLGVTQNYIPALEAGTRNPGPKLRQQLMQLFQCDFEELFQVVMINPVDNHETLLKPVPESRAEVIGPLLRPEVSTARGRSPRAAMGGVVRLRRIGGVSPTRNVDQGGA